ncbi:MAG: penicillin-binding protein activator LpoB [Planctomycetaceae bacterium]|nr:penicillin-binding protein activator LpoB [Planctomycetaceae bacterium]
MLFTRMSGLNLLLGLSLAITGCRNTQHAHVLDSDDKDMVGSHTAGAETWKPLVEQSVARLMGRSMSTIHQASHLTIAGNDACPKRTVCFVGVENKSGEEIGDFREQIYQQIDSQVSSHDQFRMISRRYVEAAMGECRCRPEVLFLPERQRELQAALERVDQPFDYLLFATITSGTTNSNGDYQRNYTLTLDLLNIHTGESIKESAELRKGYHKSLLGKIKHY